MVSASLSASSPFAMSLVLVAVFRTGRIRRASTALAVRAITPIARALRTMEATSPALISSPPRASMTSSVMAISR